MKEQLPDNFGDFDSTNNLFFLDRRVNVFSFQQTSIAHGPFSHFPERLNGDIIHVPHLAIVFSGSQHSPCSSFSGLIGVRDTPGFSNPQFGVQQQQEGEEERVKEPLRSLISHHSPQ